LIVGWFVPQPDWKMVGAKILALFTLKG
jgi:hypothetical protein